MAFPNEDEQLKQIYNEEYVNEFIRQPTRRIRRLLPHFTGLRSSDKVADYGCGTGLLYEVLRGKVAEYVGVDWSPHFIEAARRQQTKAAKGSVDFVCADIVDFCASHREEFDRAFTIDFSEHLYDDDFIRIYDAIRSSLKPEGTLYLHTPNGTFLLEILKQLGVLPQTNGHVAVRNGPAYRSLLGDIGFRGIEIHYLSHYLRGLEHLHALSSLPAVGRVFSARLFITCRR